MVINNDANKFLNDVNNKNAVKIKSNQEIKKTGGIKGGDSELGQIESFEEILKRTAGLPSPPVIAKSAETIKPAEELTFSKHAKQRLAQRNIEIDSKLINKIDGAIKKAAEKNIKNALLLSGDTAFIVSVDNNVVVTVMNSEEMKENVVTKIDGTVII